MNLFIFNGTICRDIEMKYTQNQGTPIISNSLAFNKKDAQGNQSTVFLDFVAFGKTAELINQYYQKGDMLCGTGEIAMDEWQEQDTGAKRTKHKILMSKLEFTKSPKAWANSTHNGANGSNGDGNSSFGGQSYDQAGQTQQSVEALAQNIANSGAVMGVTVTNYADNGQNSSYSHNHAPAQNSGQGQTQNTAQNLAQELDEIPF